MAEKTVPILCFKIVSYYLQKYGKMKLAEV